MIYCICSSYKYRNQEPNGLLTQALYIKTNISFLFQGLGDVDVPKIQLAHFWSEFDCCGLVYSIWEKVKGCLLSAKSCWYPDKDLFMFQFALWTIVLLLLEQICTMNYCAICYISWFNHSIQFIHLCYATIQWMWWICSFKDICSVDWASNAV